MERSLGVRLGRSLGFELPRRSAPAKRPPARRRSGTMRRLPRSGRAARGPATGLLARPRAALSAVWQRRRLRIALIVGLIVAPLLGGGWLWLRHSPLVGVEHVRVSGLAHVQGLDTAAVDQALRSAAHGMSTLDLDTARLRVAVSSYPIVRSITAHASFPHSLRIEVVEQPPVAALTVGGTRTAVAADGVVLGGGLVSGSLPAVDLGRDETAALPLAGHRLRGAWQLQAVTAIGAAPPAIAHEIERAYAGSKGLTLAMHGGLLAYFGDASRAHAKWLSLIRVLADQSSAGATYIDVRLPERPAAGFAPGSARPEAASEAEGASGAEPAATSEAGLDAAVAGGSSASTSSSGEAKEEASESGASSEEASASGESGEGSSAAGASEKEH